MHRERYIITMIIKTTQINSTDAKSEKLYVVDLDVVPRENVTILYSLTNISTKDTIKVDHSTIQGMKDKLLGRYFKDYNVFMVISYKSYQLSTCLELIENTPLTHVSACKEEFNWGTLDLQRYPFMRITTSKIRTVMDYIFALRDSNSTIISIKDDKLNILIDCDDGRKHYMTYKILDKTLFAKIWLMR